MRRGLGIHNRRSPGVFNPLSLFQGGIVQGAWYDPSDLTTLFQDSAGTTPVTAVEQPVGLMLDKSQNLTLGNTIVTNGDFSGGSTGWTLAGGASVSSGQLVFADGVYSQATQAPTGYANNWYLFEFDLTITSGSMFFRPNNSSTTDQQTYTTSGRKSFYARPTAASFEIWTSTGNGIRVDNVSVRALPGNHAYQTTSASRPTLRARYNLLLNSESSYSSNNATGWERTNATLTATNVTDPNNGTNAATFTLSANGRVAAYETLPVTQYVGSIWLKGTGSVSLILMTNGYAHRATTSVTLNSTWTRYTVTGSLQSGDTLAGVLISSSAGATVDVYGRQLTQTAVFPSNTYQRIGAATDYATGAAFPPYLFCDGIDDSMLTNSVDFATVTSDGQARRNLLTNPTQFDAAVWTKTNGSITATNIIDPFGGTTADEFTASGTSNAGFDATAPGIGNVTGTYTYSIFVKKGIGFVIAVGGVTSGVGAIFNGTTGAYINETKVGTRFAITSYSCVSYDANYWRATITVTNSVADTTYCPGVAINKSGGTTWRTGWDAVVGDKLVVYGAQLETGSTATAFQNIGTDKMLVVAGVTKNADATAVLAELSADKNANNGVFFLNTEAAPRWYWESKGTVTAATNSGGVTTFAAPITNVVTGQGNIATPSSTIRVNGVQLGSNTGSQGTGNFGNYPLFIGRRNNATLPFNGNLYSLIIAGQSYSAGQISSTESWVAAKTPLGTI